MNPLAILRLVVYGAGFLAASKGLVDFDMTTGMIDPKPFNVETAISGAANILAASALFRQLWRK